MNNQNFSKSLQKSQELLNRITENLGWQEEPQWSYQILKSTLHALRDRLPHEQVADLATQLPMLIKGLYYQGWRPAKTPQKMNKEEFLLRVKEGLQFEPDREVEEIVQAVLLSLNKFVSEGEQEDIKAVLPKDLAEIFPV